MITLCKSQSEYFSHGDHIGIVTFSSFQHYIRRYNRRALKYVAKIGRRWLFLEVLHVQLRFLDGLNFFITKRYIKDDPASLHKRSKSILSPIRKKVNAKKKTYEIGVTGYTISDSTEGARFSAELLMIRSILVRSRTSANIRGWSN